MDYAWMRARLEEFLLVCQQYANSISGGYRGDDGLRQRMFRLEPTAKKILATLDPEFANFKTETMGGDLDAARNATRGIGMIDDIAEVEQHLRPQGPVLAADGLHPWVWEAAGPFWDAGKHAVAVEQATKSLTARTQQKTGYSLADDDLMAQAWSDDAPKEGKPRLRMPGDQATSTWKSRQRGARFLAAGCYAGIRNVAAHEHEPDWPEQLALEYLATLSVLARWIDEASLELAT